LGFWLRFWTANPGALDGRQAKKDGKIEGEGSYSGTRDYNKATAKFLKKGKVGEAAKEAKRAVDSQEGAELKAAEDKGRAGDPRHMDKTHTDKAPTDKTTGRSK
jgi:hypothetical protein